MVCDQSALWSSSFKSVHSIICTYENVCMERADDSLHPFIGSKSLLVSERDVWLKQRRAFNPGFSYQVWLGEVSSVGRQL